VAAAAAAAAAVPVAAVVESVLLWVLVVLAVACAAGTVYLVAVLRAGGLGWMWRPPAPVKTPARPAVEARGAPLAIGARRVIDGTGMVIRGEAGERMTR